MGREIERVYEGYKKNSRGREEKEGEEKTKKDDAG